MPIEQILTQIFKPLVAAGGWIFNTWTKPWKSMHAEIFARPFHADANFLELNVRFVNDKHHVIELRDVQILSPWFSKLMPAHPGFFPRPDTGQPAARKLSTAYAVNPATDRPGESTFVFYADAQSWRGKKIIVKLKFTMVPHDNRRHAFGVKAVSNEVIIPD